MTPSRRSLLKGIGAGLTVLVVGHLDGDMVLAEAATHDAPTPINAWIAIGADGRVRLQCAHSEMGQGILTTFGAIMADELGADWARCDVVFSPAGEPYRHPVYGWQFTGNAESIRSYHALIRRMAAAAREMLAGAAAERWGAPVSALLVRDSAVHHPADGRSLGFAELRLAAAAQPVPASPRVNPESEWRLVGHGRSLPRLDIPAKVSGEAEFGIDVKVPGMVHAAASSGPAIGSAIAALDDRAARAMPGVLAVLSLGNVVAVVAEHYWQARLGLEAVEATWRNGTAHDDASLARLYEDAFADGPDWAVAEDKGEALKALDGAPDHPQAAYVSPWLAHAPMEPMNATVSVRPDGATVWAPTQGMQMTQVVLASVLQLPPESITIHRTYLGGGFGRRLLADFVAQAALCSRAVGRPVKLIWSREEDFRQDWYRPAFALRLKAALDGEGMPAALHHRLVAPSILSAVTPAPLKPGMVDELCVEGLVGHPYAIAGRRIDYRMLETGIPGMVLRTTGHGPNNFALESFIDELAHRGGHDPYRYRQRLLAAEPAALAVLDRAAELADWDRKAPGRHLGIAFAECFGSCLAQVAEISMDGEAFRIHRIVSVCDPGRVLDRINAAAAIEGGVVWGLSAALYSEITFDKGAPRETNFHGYRVASLPDVPELVTDFLENRSAIGGLGEVGPVCVPAALCNALFSATGIRHRRLPLARAGVVSSFGKTAR